jgi:hypothetical protein
MKRFFMTILILMVSVFLVSCAGAQKPSEPTRVPVNTAVPTKVSGGVTNDGSTNTKAGDLSRIDSQGAVTVQITPLNLDQPGDTLKFDVAMNTHSVDLSMDLATISTLTTDTGLTIQPSKWEAPSGGHHAEGTLSFPATQDGKSILEGTKQLTLTISKIDNATRTFSWDLNAK